MTPTSDVLKAVPPTPRLWENLDENFYLVTPAEKGIDSAEHRSNPPQKAPSKRRYGILCATYHIVLTASLRRRKAEPLAGTLKTNPSESPNWRKHKNACPFYRERWFPNNDVMAGEPMYQVFCMKGTPPITLEEQERCFRSKTCCWRLAQKQQSTAQQSATEEATAKVS